MKPERHWETLVRQAQQGDKQAYHRFLEEVYPFIQQQVRSKMGGVLFSVDDVTQECLIGIHRSLASWHPSKALHPWLMAIIRNKIADYFRKNMKIIKNEQSVEPDLVTYQADETNIMIEQSNNDSERLGAIMEALPDDQKRAIILTKLDGMSYKAAAKEEAITEATLRKRISRGYKTIIKQLSEADGQNE